MLHVYVGVAWVYHFWFSDHTMNLYLSAASGWMPRCTSMRVEQVLLWNFAVTLASHEKMMVFAGCCLG